MSDKAREAAARAIFAEDGPHTHPWEMQHPYRINEFRTMANAAIDAYIAALAETHAIVPREPTEAMTAAVDDVLFKGADVILAEMVWQDVYRAMLNAAGEK